MVDKPLPPKLRAALEQVQPSLPQNLKERKFVGELLLQGYSVAYIATHFYDAFGKHLDRNWLDARWLRVRVCNKLGRYNEQQDQQQLTMGLARKAERVRRLTLFAETIEAAALGNPAKVGIEYRNTIEQIKREVEGLGFDITIHPADVWGQLLQEIRDATMGHALPGAGTDNVQQAGSGSE